MPPDDRAIAISATFTAEAIQPALAFWIAELRLDYEIRFAGYSQLYQQLLDPAGLFARNRGGFNVALVRFEDWLRAGGPDGPEEHSRRLVEAVRAAAASFSVPLILVICPATPERITGFDRADQVLREGIADLAAVHLIAAAEIEATYPVEGIHDPHGDELGHLPYTPVFFVALGTAIARKIHAIATPPYKVIALDCDDTLWAGICGEDGPQGVVLDEPRRALQEEQRGRCRGDVRRPSGDAAAAGRFRGAARQLGVEERQPGVVGRGTGSRARQLHPGGRQRQRVYRSAGRKSRGAGADAARSSGRDPEVFGARVGFRPGARNGRRPAPARVVRAAGGAGTGGKSVGEPGRVFGVAAIGDCDRRHGAGPIGAGGTAHQAHQPDERFLRAALRSGDTGADRDGRRVGPSRMPDGEREGPVRKLWVDGRHAIPMPGRGTGGGHFSVELPGAGPRRGTSHGSADGRNRDGAGPRASRDSIRGEREESACGIISGIAGGRGARWGVPDDGE